MAGSTIKIRFILPFLAVFLCWLSSQGFVWQKATGSIAAIRAEQTATAAALPIPQNYGMPLDLPLLVAGTFGELRNNHFHAGLDIKTGNKENLTVRSVAEGYVSRIAVMPRGYGNVLYIDHPSGYTSVYAHLNSFEGEIGRYVEQRQYAQQRFEIDERVPPGMFPVQRGQIVAKSGNTGSSTAPHLHFELRNTASEAAVNPLRMGYYVADNIPPTITQIAVYPFAANKQATKPQLLATRRLASGIYDLLQAQVIQVPYPSVGTGIKTDDQMNGADNRNGVYALQMLDNGVLKYRFEMDEIPFEHSRALNSHIDYSLKQQNKGYLQKCFVDPGNPLPIYESLDNRGIIDLSDGALHKIVWEVSDYAGNRSTMSAILKYNPAAPAPTSVSTSTEQHTQLFSYAAGNYFENDAVRAQFPLGCFYNDLPFQYKTHAPYPTQKNAVSMVHTLHNDQTPLHSYFDVWLRPNGLSTSLYDKAVVVCTNTDHTFSCGGTWEGDMLKGKSREFGDYYIATDFISPTITPINIKNGGSMATAKTITFTISDNLSGIKSYNGYIDGQWVLMQYEQKSGKLFYVFDHRVGRGKHIINVDVSDERGNAKTYTASFVR